MLNFQKLNEFIKETCAVLNKNVSKRNLKYDNDSFEQLLFTSNVEIINIKYSLYNIPIERVKLFVLDQSQKPDGIHIYFSPNDLLLQFMESDIGAHTMSMSWGVDDNNQPGAFCWQYNGSQISLNKEFRPMNKHLVLSAKDIITISTASYEIMSRQYLNNR